MKEFKVSSQGLSGRKSGGKDTPVAIAPASEHQYISHQASLAIVYNSAVSGKDSESEGIGIDTDQPRLAAMHLGLIHAGLGWVVFATR